MKDKYSGYSDKDYQPGEKQFAGKMMGTANSYMRRADKIVDKEAAKIRKQAYKGRYA